MTLLHHPALEKLPAIDLPVVADINLDVVTFIVDSPVGCWQVSLTKEAVIRIHYLGEELALTADLKSELMKIPDYPLAKKFVKNWDDYFVGEKIDWSEILWDISSIKGTVFQKNIWRALWNIPEGQTVTYKDLAEQVGSPKAFRAVGQAVGRNPLPIILPCHRVLGSDGKLCGFMLGRGKGLDIKAHLLKLEGIL